MSIIQDLKVSSLQADAVRIENFAAEVSQIDQTVADVISRRKDEFYGKYYYLKPEFEKSLVEKWSDFAVSSVDWCVAHWKQMLLTVVIVGGAVLAIIAIVATGGLALVPLLDLIPFLSLSAAINISLGVASIAVVSTVASSAMNIMDMWGDFRDNATFQFWKSAAGWVAFFSNGAYSIGNMYNSITGVSGKEYVARKYAIENGKLGYSNLEAEHPKMKHRAGAKFDDVRKKAIIKENMRRNNGVLRDDKTGKILLEGEQRFLGSKVPLNEAQIDHVFPKSLGGDNSFSNAQVISAAANNAKNADPFFTRFLEVSIPDIGSYSKAAGALLSGNFSPIINIIPKE